MTAADIQATFCATIVDEWIRAGVTDAVVAPGSRSTPLVNALAGDDRMALHVVLDERSAGFVALGLGAATGRPAPVVTTSGTAAVELHPAVVEAHQAGVALLAVTADRPPELHGVGAPQTVDQHRLFGNSVRWWASPGVPEDAGRASWRSLAARSVAEAISGPSGPGPVHLNLAFREPLLGTAGPLPPARPGGAPWHRPTSGPMAVPDEVIRLCSEAGRGVIIAGAGAGDPDAVVALAESLGWPLLADPTSGCRVPSPCTVAGADTLLRTARVRRWSPDLVLRLGRPWASKVVGEWLAGLGPSTRQVLVDRYGRWPDPDRGAEVVVQADPSAVCRAVVAGVEVEAGAPGGGHDRDWLASWRAAEVAAQKAIERLLATGTVLTEPGVARSVVGAVPDGSTLVVSSSMPVRDVEWYGAPRRGLQVMANRGANGIDGVLSTAIGVALGRRQPTVCLLGDLAFCYDAGALLGARGRAVDCTVVVVDNDGGGIFSFLPQSGLPRDRFETLWATPHGLDLGQLAAAYRVPVVEVKDPAAVGHAVTDSLDRGGIRLVLVRTDRAANVACHDQLHRAVEAAVDMS